MMCKRFFGIAAVLSALAVLAVVAGSASAQTGNPFGCTATTASGNLLGTNLLPGTTVASVADTPCADDTRTLSATPVSIAGLNVGTVGPVQATTKLSSGAASGKNMYTRAASTSTVSALQLSLLGSTIGVDDALDGDGQLPMLNNKLQKSFSSSLKVITINGTTVPIANIGSELPTALQGVLQITPNEHTSTATSDTETLLHIELLGLAPGGGVLTLNVGTATASASGSTACAGTSGGTAVATAAVTAVATAAVTAVATAAVTAVVTVAAMAAARGPTAVRSAPRRQPAAPARSRPRGRATGARSSSAPATSPAAP